MAPSNASTMQCNGINMQWRYAPSNVAVHLCCNQPLYSNFATMAVDFVDSLNDWLLVPTLVNPAGLDFVHSRCGLARKPSGATTPLAVIEDSPRDIR